MSPNIVPSYWECPRCNERDNSYLAPRVVGQVGMARGFDIGDNEMAGGISRAVEKEVQLCKSCGERVKFFPEVVTYSDEESRERGKTGLRNGFVMFLIFLVASIAFFSKFALTMNETLFIIIELILIAFTLLAASIMVSSIKDKRR